ncbi:MAG TPA: polysaccharide deacetylase family protein [Steroidobacteraceae bacterium]|jgi:peptidoglycan/xylan/chitin deacetylase (PgdA/CDA1 family)|nr:polysaccharide deacetylase family protein [Steroidobacteraceae bacterium]
MTAMHRKAGAALRAHTRYRYSAIGQRAPFRWPNGARVAVYFALGIEEYSFGEGLAENLVSAGTHPDVLNSSWRDYGNRVGAWRVLQAFHEYRLPLAILLNSAVCESAPDLVTAAQAQGCEIIAHGYSNSDTLQGMSEQEEAEYLRRVARQIREFSGQAPAGWSSPWIAETEHTPDLLQEAGYSYVLDFCMDDQPVWLRTRRGQLLAVPYSQEINDSSTIIGRGAGAEEFSRMIIDQFDEMCRAGDELPLVMSVVIHSFISGQPFRLRALRRALEHILATGERLWIAQPGEIAKHAYALA